MHLSWAVLIVGQEGLDAPVKPPSKDTLLMVTLFATQTSSLALAAPEFSLFYLNKIFLHHKLTWLFSFLSQDSSSLTQY